MVRPTRKRKLNILDGGGFRFCKFYPTFLRFFLIGFIVVNLCNLFQYLVITGCVRPPLLYSCTYTNIF